MAQNGPKEARAVLIRRGCRLPSTEFGYLQGRRLLHAASAEHNQHLNVLVVTGLLASECHKAGECQSGFVARRYHTVLTAVQRYHSPPGLAAPWASKRYTRRSLTVGQWTQRPSPDIPAGDQLSSQSQHGRSAAKRDSR